MGQERRWGERRTDKETGQRSRRSQEAEVKPVATRDGIHFARCVQEALRSARIQRSHLRHG